MSWRKVIALGGVASAIAIGCTVSVNEGSPEGGPDEETGGSSGKDGGAGGSKATGGSGGKATGGTGGSSTGGKGGSTVDSGTGGKDSGKATVCMPDKGAPCDYCIETKCCEEWLDCVNGVDCQDEFTCIQRCMINDGGNFPDIMECAGACKMDPVGITSETNSLIACMRDTPSDGSTAQNCTNQCFGRDL
jgi:hypothetical protein